MPILNNEIFHETAQCYFRTSTKVLVRRAVKSEVKCLASINSGQQQLGIGLFY